MATSNTSLTTNLNTSPYFEDFDASKGYVRILFKPAVSVQARELTQVQSILQNQIDRFAQHIFKEGDITRGGKSQVIPLYPYVKLRDQDFLNNSINITNFINTSITGNTGGVTATVIGTRTGSEAGEPFLKTLFITYTGSGSNNTTKLFAAGEKLVANNGATANIASANTSVGFGFAVHIDEGTLYAKDHFIDFDAQTLIVNSYSYTPSAKVGFKITEAIVTYQTDSSLLDNAQGADNFAAPGADRLKLTANLVQIPLTANTGSNFTLLYEIKDGIVQTKAKNPEYSTIKDEWAKRTFEESGDYYINGLKPRIREHLLDNNNGVFTAAQGGNTYHLALGVEPGKAYVKGYDVELLVTKYASVEKGIDYTEAEQQVVAANYGNYLLVNEMTGHLDINNGATVTLLNAAERRVSLNEYSTTLPAGGTAVGTARVKAILPESGLQGANTAQYRVYLYDIAMANASFGNVRSLFYNNASTADFSADAVLESNQAVLKETNFNTGIFEIASKNIRRIRDASNQIDTTFPFLKSFDVTIATDGTFSIATGQVDEIFPFSAGALNDTQKNEFIVQTNAAGTVTLTGTVSVSSACNVITGSGTAFTTQLKAGDNVQIADTSEIKKVLSVTNNTSLILTSVISSSDASSVIHKYYYAGQVLDFTGTGSASGVERTITVNSSTSTTFDLKETLTGTVSATVICQLNRTDAKEIAKTIKRDRLVKIAANTHPTVAAGPWSVGFYDVYRLVSVRKHTSAFSSTSDGTDVTDDFEIDNGQRDGIYKIGLLKKKRNSTLTLTGTQHLLVTLDYFQHDTSQGVGYYSVDSYPIDDINGSANTNAITTKEIPIYISPVTGYEYNLRDCIDIRPTEALTATDTGVIGSATTNPAVGSSLTVPSGGLHTAVPNEEVIMDLSFYLGRKDIIALDRNGIIKVVRGNPSLTPISPEIPADSMGIAIVSIAPYPSLAPKVAQDYSRPAYACSLRTISTKRYTMREIGLLDLRMSNIERYVSLNLLEKETLDMKILDDNGLDRFKNGIFADSFQSHAFGDLNSPDYAISVDRVKNELRPKFNLRDIPLKYSTSLSSGVVNNNGVVTMPYTHVEYAKQPFATKQRNAAGLLIAYTGEMVLSPANDYWVDTQTRPDLIITDDSSMAGWEALEDAWQTEWGAWENAITGRDVRTNTNSSTDSRGRVTTVTTTTTATTSQNSRTGTDLVVSPGQATTQSYGNKVIDVSLVPYIRSQSIRVTVFGLKPNTRFYGFFDGEKVSAYLTPTNSSFVATGAEGTSVVSNAIGTVYAIFRIPSTSTLRFTVGDKRFVLTDSFSNGTDATSSASAVFSAQGLIQQKQETIVSTIQPVVQFRTISDVQVMTSTTVNQTRTVSNPPRPPDNDEEEVDGPNNINSRNPEADELNGLTDPDPLSQTFTIDESNVSGIFISKVDLFFASKDTNLGATVEIREVDSMTGYITPRVVPYSRKIIHPANINTSDTGQTATSVVFDAPIFLVSKTTYAICIIPVGGNTNTRVWVARLGERDTFNGTRVIEQPHAGVLFVSSNNRVWEPIQDEDLKFTLYRADFTIDATASLIATNDDVEFFTITTPTGAFDRYGETVHGQPRLVLSSVSGTISNGQYLTGNTSGARAQITNISGSTYTVQNLSITTKFLTGEPIKGRYANNTLTGATATLASQTVPQGDVFYYDSDDLTLYLKNANNTFITGEQLIGQTANSISTISTIDSVKFNVADIETSFLDFNRTSVEWTAKTTANTGTLDSAFTAININNNTTFDNERIVKSKSNESGTKSLQVKALLTSDNDFQSPVIDINRFHAVLVQNIINNVSTGEDNTSGGSALARHITKTIALEDGQDAEDLQVYITAYKPPETSLLLYYKVLNGDDNDTMDTVEWKPLEQKSKAIFSDKSNLDNFYEYEYGIPDTDLTGPNGEVQYVSSNGATMTGFKYFKIKTVFLSSDSSIVPRVTDLRAIALQK